MSTLFILIGAPGVGKTSYCSKHMKSLDVRVSMDDLQSMMGGDRYTNYRAELKGIYQQSEMDIIRAAIMADRDVWLDRTNMDKARRERYLTYHPALPARIVAVNFMTFERPNDNWLLYRRMKDPRDVKKKVWDKVIQDMIASYDEPTLAEGFDEIMYVKLGEVTT